MRRYLIAGVVTIVGLGGAAVPALAQARGSAEASAAAFVDPKWKAPKVAWGHPDLEGIWTSDDMRGVPMSRPAQFGTRRFLTDEEFAARARERATARKVDDARTGTFRNEEGTRDFGYTSLVIEPADGRIPALTAEARTRPAPRGTGGVGPFNTIDDFSLWDRCITRGLTGSWLPVVYGNGTRIIQTPDSVIIAHEMVHETRVIPLDGRPHLGAASTVDGHLAGPLGGQHARHRNHQLHRSHCGHRRRRPGQRGDEDNGADHPDRSGDDRVRDSGGRPEDLRCTVDAPDDPDQPARYEMYEYGCHEGNRSVPNSLSGERAYEKQAAENASKGLPPPERVFEKVNGDDRGR